MSGSAPTSTVHPDPPERTCQRLGSDRFLTAQPGPPRRTPGVPFSLGVLTSSAPSCSARSPAGGHRPLGGPGGADSPGHGDDVHWRTTSYSSEQGGNCVEVAAHQPAVHGRDSKDPEGPMLTFTPEVWSAFTAFAGAEAASR